MPITGSDWSWTLALPGGTLNPATIELLPALADGFGLSPPRPGGGINRFDNSRGREGEHRVLDSSPGVLRPLGARRERLSWWTYFAADRYRLPAPVTAGLGADIHRAGRRERRSRLFGDASRVESTRDVRR
ncbi:hypothetical protein [Amycolatopsis sp. MEPSY49]|uniref:hypothetical protein n=1 Tax=Amycolatopsis sp. MEPSY49 TaxID=3151600 RepID=UPI003EF0B232